MNIFYLSKDPKICAQYHCDKHVVKMILEYAQLLSTAHRVIDGERIQVPSNSGKRMVWTWKIDDSRENVLYKVAHVNHPSNVWARASVQHYMWLWRLWFNLCKEYEERYKKKHSTFIKLNTHLFIPPDNLDDYKFDFWQEPPLCMPDEYKEDNHIESYRNFYKNEKRPFCTWKNATPEWFK